MSRLSRKLPGFDGVSAGSTATCRCPVGLSYAQMHITYTGVTLAQMTEIRILANGNPIHRYTALELDMMNQYYARAAANGIITIDFTRNHLLSRRGQQETLLGTAPASPINPNPIVNLTIEVDIAAGAAAPFLSGVGIFDNPASAGNILKIRRFNYNANAIGLFEIADLPKGEGAIDSIFFWTDKITNLQIEKDNVVIFERSADLNKLIQTDGYFRKPDEDEFYAYNPGEEGFGSELLSTLNGEGTAYVSDLRFKLTMSAADSIPMTVRYIGGIQQ